jgi:hypothetical protein
VVWQKQQNKNNNNKNHAHSSVSAHFFGLLRDGRVVPAAASAAILSPTFFLLSLTTSTALFTYRRARTPIKAGLDHILHHFLHDRLIRFLLCLCHERLPLIGRHL